MTSRLGLALGDGGLALPDTGAIGVFFPRDGMDLSALPKDRAVVIQPFFPDHQAFARAGFACRVAPDPGERFTAALVFLPRAKAAGLGAVAAAIRMTDGPVIVDGAKTDGVDSVLKEMRRHMAVSDPVSKAHGKLFWVQGGAEVPEAWTLSETQEVEGFHTAPGVFSADGIDPGSRMLADALPAKLGRHVVDLGAGWGYLGQRILADPGVERLDLVEADHIALDCARQNISDPRAHFHWADARDWKAEERIDTVVMNPPFHTGRTQDPGLGRDFIRAAARLLAPSGRLWLVANRHLGYEGVLGECFAETKEIAGDNRFKVLAANRPSRLRR